MATASKRKPPKKKPAKRPASKKSGSEAWLDRFSEKARARIEREGYHLPIRSEQEQLEGCGEEVIEAYMALRRFCVELGEQEAVRTSHRSVMFARKRCYAFVRPKKAHLELNFFLPRALDSDLLKKVNAVSKTKWVHILHVVHSDQIDRPLTQWLEEAFEIAES